MKSKKIVIILILIDIIIMTIICNFINKNIIKEKQIIKEMSESTQVEELNSQINALNAEHTEYMNYIQTGKTSIATALANEGVATSNEATLETMAENISKVLQARTSDATATAAQILTGKTAWVNGTKITGTMTNNGAISKTINAGETYTIPLGYHDGNGKITASAANNLENLTLVVANGSNSFTSIVGKKYLVFTITTMHDANATASLSGATILSSKTIANPASGTHGSGVVFICTATSTTISFNGGNTGVYGSIAYMELN